jgi:putative transposase
VTIQVNSILKVRVNSGRLLPGTYRVILECKREGLVCLYKLPSEQGIKSGVINRPRAYALTPLCEAIEHGSISEVPEVSREKSTNGAHTKMIDDRRYSRNEKILKPLVDPQVLYRLLILNTWQAELETAAEKNDVSYDTVGRLLCRFFCFGLNLSEACKPNFWIKGVRKIGKTKLGRPSPRVTSGHRPEAIGRNTNDEDKKCIEIFYDSLEDKTIPVSTMYNGYEEIFRPQSVVISNQGTAIAQPAQDEAFITQRQFRYALKSIKGELQLLLNHAGELKTNLNHRVALKSARDLVPYPGHTYIVDATIGDVYLVSAFDLRRIIGRPVIYIVIDAFSSLIVGFHVALSGPNLDEARIAMFRALADKTRWLNWLGVGELAKWLPQGCRPAFWLVDRGELHSKGNYETQFKLETNLSVAAAYRAEWKSIVERSFGILNEAEIHWLPGAVRDRVRERGTKDPRLDAVLTLKKFMRLMLRRIAILNFTRDMSRHLSAQFISKGVSASALGFWDWGLQYCHGSAAFMSYEDGMRASLTPHVAKVYRTGVYVGGDRYVGNWMSDHSAVQQTGFGATIQAQMFASPDEPGVGWCALPAEHGMREVQLHSDRQVMSEYAMEDISECEAVRKFTGQDLADDTAQQRIKLQRENRREIAEAQADAKAAHQDSPLSKAARTANINANRKQEVSALSKGEQMSAAPTAAAVFFRPSTPAQPETHSPPPPATAAAGNEAKLESPKNRDEYFSRLSEHLGDWDTA